MPADRDTAINPGVRIGHVHLKVADLDRDAANGDRGQERFFKDHAHDLLIFFQLARATL